MMREKCFVCSTEVDIDQKSGTYYDVHCLRRGRYKVDFTGGEVLAKLDEEVKPRVSRWIHDQCALGTIPNIATREIEFLRSLKPLPFEERANGVLLYIAKQTKIYGAPIRLFGCPEFSPLPKASK